MESRAAKARRSCRGAHAEPKKKPDPLPARTHTRILEPLMGPLDRPRRDPFVSLSQREKEAVPRSSDTRCGSETLALVEWLVTVLSALRSTDETPQSATDLVRLEGSHDSPIFLVYFSRVRRMQDVPTRHWLEDRWPDEISPDGNCRLFTYTANLPIRRLDHNELAIKNQPQNVGFLRLNRTFASD